MPTQFTVTITVTGNTITYSDPDKQVYSGDEVRWICNKDFAVIFEQKKSPFSPKVLSVSAPANTYTAYFTARPVRKRTHHKYMVAAYIGGTPPIAIDDPQIIVDNDGGGGKSAAKKKTAKKKRAKK